MDLRHLPFTRSLQLGYTVEWVFLAIVHLDQSETFKEHNLAMSCHNITDILTFYQAY